MRRISRGGRMLVILAALVVSFALAACGSSGSKSSSGSHTLRTALTADPSPLDPDSYYEAEGLAITTAVYEGLLTYGNDSPKIVPALATSWEVSDGARTFTFKLRKGVKFSDGTAFDSSAAKASFQRRIDLNAGPSYMLADVASMETPDPSTFVVHLKHPSSVFLDYLASPYGPLITSPTAVKQHTLGKKDHASKWFGSHSAGTGAYVLSKVQRGSLYQLTANKYYHGAKPYFTTVNFNVVPIATQRLQVQGGQQDLILQRLPQRDLTELKGDSKVQVVNFKNLYKAAVWINPSSKVFGPAASRAALRAYLNNDTLTKQLYGEYGTTSTDVYPAGMLPPGAAPDKPQYDPSALPKTLAAFKGQHVTVGFYNASGQMKVLANRLQTEFQSMGLDATIREYPPSILFNLPGEPGQRPDILATAFNPDALAPDTFSRIYYYKDAPVNLLGCTAPQGDALLDKASTATTEQAALKYNVAAAEAYRASNCWLNITDAQDVFVARKGISGFEHELPWTLDLRLSTLKGD